MQTSLPIASVKRKQPSKMQVSSFSENVGVQLVGESGLGRVGTLGGINS